MSDQPIGPGATIASRSHPEWGRGRVIQVVAAPTGGQAFVEFDSGRLEKLPVADLDSRPDMTTSLAQAGPESAAAFDLRTFAAALRVEHVRTGACPTRASRPCRTRSYSPTSSSPGGSKHT